MAYTAGFSVNVGDPTKASDVTTLAANDDFLKAAVDAIMADSATPSSTLKATVVLADGVTATTQSAGNNTTRVATTAFVKTAVDASSTDPGGSNKQVQFNNSSAFGGSANLAWDNSNNRLGIGTDSPDKPLHVDQATDTTDGTDPIARFERDGSSQTGIAITSNSLDGLILRADSAGFGAIHSYEDLGFYTGVRPGSSYGDVAMRIETNGNVGIGTTSPDGTLHVHTASCGTEAASAYGNVLVIEDDGDNGMTILTPDGSYGQMIWQSPSASGAGISTANARIAAGYNSGSPRLDFSVGATSNMMTLWSSGDVLIGTSSTTNAGRFKVENSDAEYTSAFFNSNGSSPYGLFLSFSGAAPNNNTTNHYLHCNDSSGSDRLKIWSNGDVQNANGTYGTLSDIKLKQDIADMRSYWADFKSLQYRKYRHKSDVDTNTDAPYRIGLVAQEVEPVFPSLVVDSIDQEQQDVAVLDEDGNATYEQTEKVDAEGNAELDADGNAVMIDRVDDDGNKIAITETKMVDLGTTTKWVKSSIIEGPIMASVVQELQTRLEAAEAKIAAQEAA